ncbi:2Fe-2S iron-sulfur cluster-binding protein [Saccharopolyspora taberi]|uniref:2Fe-2S iron-sulfur cluster-binding protein n=1 Tax=Saccharopolyspora taberi TaxID=60895 RepID=A0ABN3VG17_9PSEU
MPKITYVHFDRTQDTVDVPVGTSVMRGAVSNDVDGIVAECGGNAQCGTCHVYVEPDWLPKLLPIQENEDEMLDGTFCERQPNSRLSCQLKVTEQFDGLVVHTPERQV